MERRQSPLFENAPRPYHCAATHGSLSPKWNPEGSFGTILVVSVGHTVETLVNMLADESYSFYHDSMHWHPSVLRQQGDTTKEQIVPWNRHPSSCRLGALVILKRRIASTSLWTKFKMFQRIMFDIIISVPITRNITTKAISANLPFLIAMVFHWALFAGGWGFEWQAYLASLYFASHHLQFLLWIFYSFFSTAPKAFPELFGAWRGRHCRSLRNNSTSCELLIP
jgi:hypothetical protein